MNILVVDAISKMDNFHINKNQISLLSTFCILYIAQF